MARRGGSGQGVPRGDAGTRTRRVVVLLALAVVCALVLAPPLRLYVQQQRDISALQAENAQRQADIAALEAELRLWDDEAYVAAQARERLGLVRPGEVGFVVPDPEPSGAPGDDALGGSAAAVPVEPDLARPDAPPEGTWYGRLWSSVEAVGAGAEGDPVLDAPVVSGTGGGTTGD